MYVCMDWYVLMFTYRWVLFINKCHNVIVYKYTCIYMWARLSLLYIDNIHTYIVIEAKEGYLERPND